MTARGDGGPSGESGGTTIAAAGAAVLRAGSLYGAIAGAAGVVVSAFWGPAAAASFALGAALSVAALAVGPLLLRASEKASPPAVTAAAVGGYAGVVLVLGGAFLALAPVSSLSSEHLAAALVAVTVAGLAGQIRAVTRLRVLAFGEPPDPQVTGSPAARSDDAAQSSRPTTR
jgi:hypothetical protein